MHLSPYEHIFSGQADLFVAFAHIGAHGGHDFFFREIDLRIQIGHADFAAAAAAGGHLDHTEGGAFIGHEQRFTLFRMADLDLARQLIAVDRLAEDRHRVFRFTAPFDHTINAELLEGIGLRDLPSAGAADDDLEVPAVRVVFDPGEHQSG